MQDLWGLKGTKRVWAPEEVSNFGKLGWDSQFWGLWPQLHHQERLLWQDNHCDLADSMLSILIEEICQTKWGVCTAYSVEFVHAVSASGSVKFLPAV